MPLYVVNLTDKKQTRYAMYEIEAENIEKAAEMAVDAFVSKDVSERFLVDLETMVVAEVDLTNGQSLAALARWDIADGHKKAEDLL